MLGVARPRRFGLPDGALDRHHDELAAAIGSMVREHDPEVVLTPWALDDHPDHRALPAALADVTAFRGEVWGYEVHLPLIPNRVVDISAVLARKRAALAAHATAAVAMDLDATLGLNRWRALAAGPGASHAEAFHVLSAADHRALIRDLTSD